MIHRDARNSRWPYRSFYSALSMMVSVVIVFLWFMGLVSSTAFSQSDAGTAEAKQHYQNAVAAIAKSDWQTAKNELLKAVKLAPQNALVHYDLALAYSHTGQINSARAELTKALQFGLPAEQKQAAAELKQKLANASNAPGTISNTKHVPSSTQESAVHALNQVITTELGVTLNNYRPYGFTYEVSTGKLWWERLTNSGCEQWPNGANTSFGSMGARLTDLDPDGIVATTDKSGSKITVTCRNNGRCFENWMASYCMAMAAWTHSHEDSVETFSKSLTQQGHDAPMIFREKLEGLDILTTGDPDATQKAINLLKQLIALAPPPSEAYLAEAARQKAEETNAEQKKQAENLALDSALEGQWRYTDGLTTTWTLSIRVDSGKLAGSIVHAYHRDAKYHEGRCTTQDPPGFCSAVSPENRSDVCLPKTTCTQSRTTPGKDWTVYWALEGNAKGDAGVRMSGQYQRCAGDCDPVSNPHEMDIGDQGMELRESKLYWAGKQFTKQ
ncbi:MAG: tetratricopeptide repeat protein [Terriglobales bacterium]